MATEAADALSPDNLSVLPRVFPTAGQIRGATAVEVLSFITDPLNALMFAGPVIKAAKAMSMGARVGLKDVQLLRKAGPTARRLMAEEAGGRAPGLTKPVPADLKRMSDGDILDLFYSRTQGVEDVVRGRRSVALVTPGLEPGDVAMAKKAGLLRAEPKQGGVIVYGTDQPAINRVVEFFEQHAYGGDAFESLRLSRLLGYGEDDIRLFRELLSRRGEFVGKRLFEQVPDRGGALSGREAAARLRGRDLPGTRALTRQEIVKESPDIKAARTKVAGEGRTPPPSPPPRLPGEPPGLLPGGQAPSQSLWRIIESGLFLSPRAGDLMRKTAEVIGDAPAIKLFMKAVTGPAALARVVPEIRAGVVYRRLQGVMEAELGQRLVGQEEAFYRAFILGRDRSKVVVSGKELAFGDYATNILKGPRIGAKHGKFAATPA
ncbi:hypothetical protein LCGC14_2333410, partial [marine sediment metagenome]